MLPSRGFSAGLPRERRGVEEVGDTFLPPKMGTSEEVKRPQNVSLVSLGLRSFAMSHGGWDGCSFHREGWLCESAVNVHNQILWSVRVFLHAVT